MNRIFTKLFFAFLLTLTFYCQNANAQCMLKPIAIADRIANSTLIVEGRIISSQCMWDEKQQNIYTVYDIDVTKFFKGTSSTNIVKLVEAGGTIGMQKDVVSNGMEYRFSNAGVFMLIPTNDPFASSLNYLETYAGPQGYIAYNHINKNAQGVFDFYNTNTELFTTIQNNTGIIPTDIKLLDWQSIVDRSNEEDIVNTTLEISQSSDAQSAGSSTGNSVQAVSSGGSISSFSPTSMNAGRYETLTINGSGFGASQGTSYVEFANANTGGTTYTKPLASQYILWSNTQIQVVLPTLAGTGTFRVSDGTNTINSSTSLDVGYNLTNVKYNVAVGGSVDSYYIAKHISDNGAGGYTFQCFADFAANAPALADFTALLKQWECTTGINWKIGSNTTIDTIASDGTNVIRFDNGTELPAGVLGRATSRYNGCISGSIAKWYIGEIDVVFDDATSWFYGSGSIPFTSYDFYSVGVHEMGHAHQLGHVIDPTKVMNYSIANGDQARTLSTSELAGGLYMIAYDTVNAYCSQPLHIPYAYPQLAQASTNNAASIIGNYCDTRTQIDGTKIKYTDANCNLLLDVTDASGGNVLGSVSACVTVLDSVHVHNGQPYLPRYFEITPASQGSATLTFYFTQADVNSYNAKAPGYGFPTMVANGSGNLLIAISQVPGGALAGASSSTTTVHNATAVWDATNSRWSTTITVTSFSGFYLHTRNPGNFPLSISSLQFSGKILPIANQLNWTTQSEVNNDYFIVKHSVDGKSFNDIQHISSAAVNGNSNSELQYNFLHKYMSNGPHYYQLQMIDKSGNLLQSSNTVLLQRGSNLQTVQVYPNPANQTLHVALNLNKTSIINIAIIDVSGRVVKIQIANLQNGANTLSVAIGNLAQGIYTIQVSDETKILHRELVQKL